MKVPMLLISTAFIDNTKYKRKMHYITGVLLVATCVSSALALPPCTCTRNYKPVCGSDGTTYNNECLLNCERRNKRELTITKQGSCDELPADNCICTYEYLPVCGTDGTTYPNKCSLSCARSQLPTLELRYEGRCKRDAVQVAQLEPCTCTREMKPVCGSDGATYSNPCLLNCAMQANSHLSVKHTGPCSDRVQVVEQPEQDSGVSCACTRNLAPVCGSDGVTYNNPCLLNCATQSNPNLRVKYTGECADRVQVVDQPEQDRESCACTRNLEPVCASDGVTYNNQCLMYCVGGSHLTVVHPDACED